ncbi:hypothetical protein ACFWBM_09415 [Streptomyces sp. NPDC059980]|uniref:hypothetical protein n=1 Tax=Streptomyces sp. NPDC059980 TaxID=3347022 RepID=UPI00367B57F7
MSESDAEEVLSEGRSRFAEVLDEGLSYSGVYHDGRLQVTMEPAAFDALVEILDRRRRHLPVPPDAIDELRYWQQYVCTAHPHWHTRDPCTNIVEDAGQRCSQHLAINRLHPQAHRTLDALSPRARSLFQQLLDQETRYFDYNRTRGAQLSKDTGLSASTLNRSLRELADSHLAWRKGHGGCVVVHPAVAFFDGYKRHREALEDLRLDRRTAFSHLEPPVEHHEEAAA